MRLQRHFALPTTAHDAAKVLPWHYAGSVTCRTFQFGARTEYPSPPLSTSPLMKSPRLGPAPSDTLVCDLARMTGVHAQLMACVSQMCHTDLHCKTLQVQEHASSCPVTYHSRATCQCAAAETP